MSETAPVPEPAHDHPAAAGTTHPPAGSGATADSGTPAATTSPSGTTDERSELSASDPARRRRGTRGGRKRGQARRRATASADSGRRDDLATVPGDSDEGDSVDVADAFVASDDVRTARRQEVAFVASAVDPTEFERRPADLPDRPIEGRVTGPAAEAATVPYRPPAPLGPDDVARDRVAEDARRLPDQPAPGGLRVPERPRSPDGPRFPEGPRTPDGPRSPEGPRTPPGPRTSARTGTPEAPRRAASPSPDSGAAVSARVDEGRPPARPPSTTPSSPSSAPSSSPSSSPARRRGPQSAPAARDPGPRSPAAVKRPLSDEDADVFERRRGRERKGRPVGRYLMCVHVTPKATQIAVLEGRSLIEHYISRPSDLVAQIHGNVYLGRVQNVLPGMEAAFIDIGTPKNAVLYRSDIQLDAADHETVGTNGTEMSRAEARKAVRIEDILRNGQSILCQVTKNPIGSKGARLTQDVSLPGRFCVLVPNSDTYGISKRLSDDERKRLRQILDEIRPSGHGLIVRTAAEGASADELRKDVQLLLSQWDAIETKAKKSKAPTLLYREPDMAVRVIREEFNHNYRGVVIDDPELHREVHDYVETISPDLADRVEHFDPVEDPLPLFERFHIHEQLHKAVDRKVWLPSGGSIIIERTEALTVIDVNTGKNVGSTNLEETVFRNNLEAADEIAHQLRLRDIGGIIVIDFIDMEIAQNRSAVIQAFRDALSRDKTRTQVFDISELGLVQMTRKRIGEGLVESFSQVCPSCDGRGTLLDEDLL